MGERVRWDGGDKRSAFVADRLASTVELVPVCPEVELGLGVPREPIRLEDGGSGLRLVDTETHLDLGPRMDGWAKARALELSALPLCGFVLKAGSPSCGMENVPIWREPNGPKRGRAEPRPEGRGRFAEALIRAMPDLPIIEEGALANPQARDRWLERVHALHRSTAC